MAVYQKNIAGMLCIGLVVTIYFARLFVPQPKLLVSQDLGRSDAWHFSFASKYALSQSLRNGVLPLWRNDIGDGFPSYAEGQSGALFIPNLIAFTLFDAVTAFNLALAGSIAAICIGVFLWCRVLGFSLVAAVFAGITSGFSAYPIMQLPHITLLQGLSVMPFLLAATHQIAIYGAWPWVSVFALLLSQQIFAGFPQATFLSILFCLWYMLWLSITTKTWSRMILLASAIVVGCVAAAAQLLPSWEFLQHSTFPHGFDMQTASRYSFPLIDLWSLVQPFAIGNPKIGWYPQSFMMDGNIVWENTIYLGLLPIVLIGLVLFRFGLTRLAQFFGVSSLVGLMMAWGKYSPVYLLYGVWPLTLFRVPSRFIWISTLSLVMIATIGINAIARKTTKVWVHILLATVVCLHSFQLMSSYWEYHLYVPAAEWLQAPAWLPLIGPGRVLTIGEVVVQHQKFIAGGWKNPDPYYKIREGMSAQSNIVWGVRQHGIYAGRFLLRSTVMDDLLNRQSIRLDTRHATISATAQKLFDMFAVDTVISLLPLTQDSLTQVHTSTASGITVSVYHNSDALPRAYIVHEATTAATFEQAGRIIQSPQFDPTRRVLLETHQVQTIPEISAIVSNSISSSPQVQDRVVITRDKHTQVDIHTESGQNAILVLADTDYPGWEASVDGASTPILTANFTQRAIYLPQGSHNIQFKYNPHYVRTGILISVVGYCIIAVLMVFPAFGWRPQPSGRNPQLFARRRHNRGK